MSHTRYLLSYQYIFAGQQDAATRWWRFDHRGEPPLFLRAVSRLNISRQPVISWLGVFVSVVAAISNIQLFCVPYLSSLFVGRFVYYGARIAPRHQEPTLAANRGGGPTTAHGVSIHGADGSAERADGVQSGSSNAYSGDGAYIDQVFVVVLAAPHRPGGRDKDAVRHRVENERR